jgi:hypothetical protein
MMYAGILFLVIWITGCSSIIGEYLKLRSGTSDRLILLDHIDSHSGGLDSSDHSTFSNKSHETV